MGASRDTQMKRVERDEEIKRERVIETQELLIYKVKAVTCTCCLFRSACTQLEMGRGYFPNSIWNFQMFDKQIKSYLQKLLFLHEKMHTC